MAIQTWGGARSCYRFRDYGPHSAQTEQSGATAPVTCPSQRGPQFHFMARPNVGRGKLAHLDLISDALPFGRLWYGGLNAARNTISYAKHYSNSHDAVDALIRVYDQAGNVIETHEHKGDFKEW
jgi:hypothetical protein